MTTLSIKYNETNAACCSQHYLRQDVIYGIVLERLQYWIGQAHNDKGKLLNKLLQSGDTKRASELKRIKTELNKAQKRKSSLDNLFSKLYEDRVTGKISEYNFTMLSQKYQSEQTELNEKCENLQAELDRFEQSADDAQKWIDLISKYTELTELTAPLLNELIDKIVVHEAYKGADGNRTQEIEIYYRFIGKIE